MCYCAHKYQTCLRQSDENQSQLKSSEHSTMTDDNIKETVVPPTPRLIPPLQRRHSDPQSRALRLEPSTKPVELISNESNRGRPESPSLIKHPDSAVTESSGYSKACLIKDGTQDRPSSSRNNTEASSVAAHWVASQADFVGNPVEAASSLKSHPTRSSQSPANSTASIATTPGSQLPALQGTNITDQDGLKPLLADEIDPTSFDLVAPPQAPDSQYSIEAKSELLFSVEHLRVILEDPKHTQKFADFIYTSRPEAVPIFNCYLGLMKALKAIDYANAIMNELSDLNSTPLVELPLDEQTSKSLKGRADETLAKLAEEELQAYVTHVWTQIVRLTIKQRITGTLPLDLREMSEGLAEVFCLTDPSRHDNPIVLASEEFHRATRYGRRFALGRNSRFLQGPKTNPESVKRFREMLAAGKEHCEPLLNYRRDGSVFMNLLMVAPLYDNRGNIRYYLGAQVDVSGLLKECAGLTSLKELVVQKQQQQQKQQSEASDDDVQKDARESCASRDALGELAERFNLNELKIVQASGENMHDTSSEERNSAGGNSSTDNQNGSRSLVKVEAPLDNSISSSAFTSLSSLSLSGRCRGILDHYLLVRPFPSMRILFASPSLRVPGILQSPFLSRIGGPQTVRDAISKAFQEDQGIKTKVRWLARPAVPGLSTNTSPSQTQNHGRSRWIHTTPLFGINGAVGVWMVILVDEEEKRRLLEAPPVELFNLERSQPFDVSVVNLTSENLDDRSSQGVENEEKIAEVDDNSLTQDAVEVSKPGPVRLARP